MNKRKIEIALSNYYRGIADIKKLNRSHEQIMRLIHPLLMVVEDYAYGK